MMNPVGELIDPKIARIIALLIKNRKDYFHLQKISQEAGVPISTTFRIINKLVNLGFIEKTNVGNFKIYKIAGNRKTAQLCRVLSIK